MKTALIALILATAILMATAALGQQEGKATIAIPTQPGTGPGNISQQDVNTSEGPVEITTPSKFGILTPEELSKLGYASESKQTAQNIEEAPSEQNAASSASKTSDGVEPESDDSGKTIVGTTEATYTDNGEGGPVANTLTDEEIQEEEGASLREWADSNGIYLPPAEKESNAELTKKFDEFTTKHKSELLEKYETAANEEQAAEIAKQFLKQFSEETYKKPEPTIVQKVFSFFKKLF